MSQYTKVTLSSLRRDFLGTPFSALVTIVIIGGLAWLFSSLFDWGVLNAVTVPDLQACRATDGACWGFVAEKWRLILFGRYPYDLQWRAALATCLLVGLLVISAIPIFWSKRRLKFLAWAWVLAFIGFFILMGGGCFGLEPVDSDSWGGLPLTVILTLIGMTASTPLGILLALGRRCAWCWEPCCSPWASGASAPGTGSCGGCWTGRRSRCCPSPLPQICWRRTTRHC